MCTNTCNTCIDAPFSCLHVCVCARGISLRNAGVASKVWMGFKFGHGSMISIKKAVISVQCSVQKLCERLRAYFVYVCVCFVFGCCWCLPILLSRAHLIASHFDFLHTHEIYVLVRFLFLHFILFFRFVQSVFFFRIHSFGVWFTGCECKWTVAEMQRKTTICI